MQQRVERAREVLGLGPTAIVVMTSAVGTSTDTTDTRAWSWDEGRRRFAEQHGLDPQRSLLAGAGAVVANGDEAMFLPLNPTNTDFAEPIRVPRGEVTLRWWDHGGRASSVCRLWFTLADGRWDVQDVPRKAMFMRSKFAVGLDELIAALGGQQVEPIPITAD